MRTVSRNIIFLSLLFAAGNLRATGYALFIAFQSGDCINCSAPIGQLGTLDPRITVTLVVELKNKAFFKEFTDGFEGFNKLTNTSICYSDSLFQKYNTLNGSSCHFLESGRERLCFPLNKFFDHRDEMNAMAISYGDGNITGISIDSIPLSERITVQREDGHVFLYDYLLNKAVVCNASDLLDNKTHFMVLKPNISKIQLMNMARLDTGVYKNLLPLFQSLHKDRPHFEGLFYEGDTLHAFTVFNYPKFKGNDTIISNYYFVLNYINGKPHTAYYILKDSMENSTGYFLDNTMPFYANKGTYCFTVFRDKAGRDNKIITTWDRSKRNLVFTGFKNLTVPAFYSKSQERYESMTALIKDQYYFYTTYPYIINLRDSSAFDLGPALEKSSGKKLFSSKKFNNRFYVSDVYRKGDILFVLYFIDKDARVLEFNTSSKQVIAEKQVSLKNEYFLPSLAFINENILIVLNQERNKIFILK